MVKDKATNSSLEQAFEDLMRGAPARFVTASDSEALIESTDEELPRVIETTMYQCDFPIYLRRRFQGCTLAELAIALKVPESHASRYLDGQWRPSKAVCRLLGLKTVYAFSDGES